MLLGIVFANVLVLDVLYKLGLPEGNAARGLAHTQLLQGEEFSLVEDIGEEGIGCVIGREVFAEQEKLINVVEDAMHEGGQQIWLAIDLSHFDKGLFTNRILSLLTNLAHYA